MPVDIQWRSHGAILQTSYQGVLSPEDYYGLCEERQTMLEDGPPQVILVADVRQLEGFPKAESIRRGENILMHRKVYCTLVILEDRLFHTLERTLVEGAPNQRVYFFPDVESAMRAAEEMTAAWS